MNKRRFSTISLAERDYVNFDEKLSDAIRWVELAAAQGAELAVLPEALNVFQPKGGGNAWLGYNEAAVEDWRTAAGALIECGTTHGVALVIPMITREAGGLTNSFFLVDAKGNTVGRYQKMQPTAPEIEAGVRPGAAGIIEWEGLTIGGAICFDTNFPRIFELQAGLGAQLFIVPSLWPGGSQLEHYALKFSTPIILSYPAWSRIIGIDGKDLTAGGYRNETLRMGFGSPVFTATINFDRMRFHADTIQESIVLLQTEYGDAIDVIFDQINCSFFVESLSPEFTMKDFAKRHGLTPFGEYLAQFAMAH